MTRPKKKWPVVAAVALPLLCGALWFRSSNASIPPGAGRDPLGAGRDFLAKLGVDPDNLSQEDKVAFAQRARQGGGVVLAPAEAQKLEARVQSNPKDAFAHQTLGFYYRHKSRDLVKAIHHNREAVRLDPANGLAKWDLGMTLMRAGQRDQAMRAFEEMANAKVGGSGLARKFAEEDVELGRKWLEKMRAKPSLGLPRTSIPTN